LSELAEAHRAQGVRFFGISEEDILGPEDEKADVAAFVRDRTDMRYDVGVDLDGRARKVLYDECGQRGIPSGELLSESVGDSLDLQLAPCSPYRRLERLRALCGTPSRPGHRDRQGSRSTIGTHLIDVGISRGIVWVVHA
jgi:hypothetical protein